MPEKSNVVAKISRYDNKKMSLDKTRKSDRGNTSAVVEVAMSYRQRSASLLEIGSPKMFSDLNPIIKIAEMKKSLRKKLRKRDLIYDKSNILDIANLKIETPE